MMSGLDIHEDLGEGHPLAGHRMPDLDLVAATGPGELPVLGAVTVPAAALIRPDGHVARAGDPARPGLPDALATWFGPPAAA